MRCVDLVRVEPPLGHRAADRAGGVDELGAAAVVDAHGEREDVVVAGHLLGDPQLLDDRLPQPRGATGPAHADAELVHLVAPAADDVAVEAHQEADLVGRAGPVLGGEGVGGDRLHADLDGALDDVEQRVLALLVPLGARQPALLGPAAVAVHHDRDVARHEVGGHGGGPGAAGVRGRRTDASLHGANPSDSVGAVSARRTPSSAGRARRATRGRRRPGCWPP